MFGMERRSEVKVLSAKKLKDLLEPYIGKNEHTSLRISNGCTIKDTPSGVVMESAYGNGYDLDIEKFLSNRVVMESAYGNGYVDLDIEKFLSNIYSAFAGNPFAIGMNVYPDGDTWCIIRDDKLIKTKTPVHAIPMFFNEEDAMEVYVDENGVNFNKGESKMVLKTHGGIEQISVCLDEDGTMSIYLKDSKGSRFINSKGESGDTIYTTSQRYINIIEVISGTPIVKAVKDTLCVYPNLFGINQPNLVDIGDKKYKVVSVGYRSSVLIEIDEQIRTRYLLEKPEHNGVICLDIVNTSDKEEHYYMIIDLKKGSTTILRTEEEIELAIKLIRSIEFIYDGMITIYSDGKLKRAKPFASGYILEDKTLVTRNGKVLLEDVKDEEEIYSPISSVNAFYANDKIYVIKDGVLHSYPKADFGNVKDFRYVSNSLFYIEGSKGVSVYIGNKKVVFSDKVSHTSVDGALLDKDYKLIEKI